MMLWIEASAKPTALLFVVEDSLNVVCHLGEGLFPTFACPLFVGWYTCVRHNHFCAPIQVFQYNSDFGCGGMLVVIHPIGRRQNHIAIFISHAIGVDEALVRDNFSVLPC